VELFISILDSKYSGSFANNLSKVLPCIVSQINSKSSLFSLISINCSTGLLPNVELYICWYSSGVISDL